MGRFKPLLHIGLNTVTDRLVTLYRDCSIEVILVVGYRKDDLLAGIGSYDIQIVETRLPERNV